LPTGVVTFQPSSGWTLQAAANARNLGPCDTQRSLWTTTTVGTVSRPVPSPTRSPGTLQSDSPSWTRKAMLWTIRQPSHRFPDIRSQGLHRDLNGPGSRVRWCFGLTEAEPLAHDPGSKPTAFHGDSSDPGKGS
jgi:hypothetical protein